MHIKKIHFMQVVKCRTGISEWGTAWIKYFSTIRKMEKEFLRTGPAFQKKNREPLFIVATAIVYLDKALAFFSFYLVSLHDFEFNGVCRFAFTANLNGGAWVFHFAHFFDPESYK